MSAARGEAEALHWLALALGDLATARAILVEPALPARGAAEHAQQAAEKALKAAIAVRGDKAPRTHDLARLRMLVPDLVDLDPAIDLDALSDAHLAGRYRDPLDVPLTSAEVRGLIDAAAQVVDVVTARLATHGLDVGDVAAS